MPETPYFNSGYNAPGELEYANSKPAETPPQARVNLSGTDLMPMDQVREISRALQAGGAAQAEREPAGQYEALADKFRQHFYRYRPQIFGEDDRIAGPPITRTECAIIAAALDPQDDEGVAETSTHQPGAAK